MIKLKPIPKKVRFLESWGCPYTLHFTRECWAFCKPCGGIGTCGRPAPHALRGRTQRAIARHKAEKERVRRAS
ncbi:hypothetical protein ACFL51_01065 [Myxococcota bacterium]